MIEIKARKHVFCQVKNIENFSSLLTSLWERAQQGTKEKFTEKSKKQLPGEISTDENDTTTTANATTITSTSTTTTTATTTTSAATKTMFRESMMMSHEDWDL